MTKDTCRVGEAKRRRTQGRRERAKVLMTRMKGGMEGWREGRRRVIAACSQKIGE